MSGAESVDRGRVANEQIIAAVLERAGLSRVRPDRLRVESIRAASEPGAVDVVLHAAGADVRLRFSRRDLAQPVFERTRSFNVRYMRDSSSSLSDAASARTPTDLRLDALLRALIARVALGDPGELALDGRISAPERRLPLVANGQASAQGSAAGSVSSAFRRDLFDASVDALVTRGDRVDAVVIVVSQACEMSCAFCPSSDRASTPDYRADDAHDRQGAGDETFRAQTADLLHQLTRGRELGARAVDFGGNDVLRYPDILTLFERAGAAGYTRIVAQSPGQILSDAAFAAAVVATPLTEIHLPIYGARAEVHDRITGRAGAFDGLCRAIDNVQTHKCPTIRLHTIALASTFHALPELIDFCRTRFDLPLVITPLRSNRQGEREVVADVASYAELAPIIERFPQSFRTEWPLCQLPASSYAALPNLREELPPLNFYDLGLPAGSEDAEVAAERARLYPSTCTNCTKKSHCNGVLGNYLQRFGDADLRAIL